MTTLGTQKDRTGGAPASVPESSDREAAVPPHTTNLPSSRIPGGSAAPPTGQQPSISTDREAAVPPHNTFPQRKHPAHLPSIERPNQPIILFVTVCAQGRRTVLANKRVHDILIDVWSRTKQYRVGHYIVMPDHVHLFCSPAVHEPENVRRWVAYWKRLASIELKELQPLWQRDCWDTQVRDATHYGERWEYVAQNPVRKGLVPRPEDWSYQGCLNELRW